MNFSILTFLAPAIAAHAIAALTMVFIPLKDEGARFTAVIAIAAFCFRAIAAADRSTDEGQMYAEYMFGFVLHANCFLVLLHLGAPKAGQSLWQRFPWAFVTLFSPRRKLQRKDRYMKTRPGTFNFVTLRLVQFLVTAVAHDYLKNNTLLPFPRTPSDITSDKTSLITQLYHGTLTSRDLLIRAEMSFLSLTMPALLLSMTHTAASLFAVPLPNFDPAAWPQLFDNIFDAWSVRRWYSHFWEKLMRKAFTINASYLTIRVFGLKPASTKGRCVITMLAFTMSGLMHTISGWQPEPCASWMPMWKYLATGVVILLETGLQTLYARYVHSRKGLNWRWYNAEVWGWRLIGYCWVAFWWLEVLPWAIMPGMRCNWAPAA